MRDTLKLLWFFLWRTGLLGLVLVGLLAAAYAMSSLMLAMVVNTFTQDEPGYTNPVAALIWVIGTGLAFGTWGALVGALLGALGGLSLGLVTRFRYRAPTDLRGYRRMAGMVCAAISIAALSATWAAQGFDPATFVLWRPFDLPEGDETTALTATVTMALMITGAMWWAGRKVAAWYLNRPREPEVGTSGFTGRHPTAD